VDAEEIISLSVCLFFRPSRPREQTKTDDSFSGPRKDYGPERDPCKRRSDRRLVSHGIMLSDLSWDLWVNGSSPAAGLTRDVFGGGEDKNHEPIMLPVHQPLAGSRRKERKVMSQPMLRTSGP